MEKEKIFKVAEEHFFAKRYTDVKLDNIANSLNIQKPSLYYYFIDKKDLFLQTIKYSMNKYIKSLENAVKEKDLEKFLNWYLVYPSDNKNLFAIAFQKGYCIDRDINSTILSGKILVDRIINNFFLEFGLTKVKIYLILNLLEKLAQDNCVDGYCLKYKISDILPEIKNFLEK